MFGLRCANEVEISDAEIEKFKTLWIYVKN